MARSPCETKLLLLFINSLTTAVGVLVTGGVLGGVDEEGLDEEGLEEEGLEDEGADELGSEDEGSEDDGSEDEGSLDKFEESLSDVSGNCSVGIETSGTGTSATRLPVQAVNVRERTAARIRQKAFFIMKSP